MKISAIVLMTALLVTLLAPVRATGADEETASKLRARQFVVMGYLGIRSDLERGSGPYLNTLFDLLGTPASDRSALVEEIRSLAAVHLNIMDFADRVTAIHVSSPAGAASTVPLPSGPTVHSGDSIAGALGQLTRGAPVAVYLHGGEIVEGTFVEYQARRLWLRGASRRSVLLRDIAAVNVAKP